MMIDDWSIAWHDCYFEIGINILHFAILHTDTTK